jgi:hypothetical protein
MGCGCNKNKQNPVFKPETAPTEIKNILTSRLGMVASFAKAIASRGLSNKKVEKPIKQLRVLSCFGNQEYSGSLPPCQNLKPSETPGKFFCGGCGCGDKPKTWLMGNGEEYSKLDYPSLTCPLKMPGFSNYEPSSPDEQTEPITRKFYIENVNYPEISKINVTNPEVPNTLE